MTYATQKELIASRKDLLAVIECAERVTDWVNVSGNTYYYDFQISNEHIEYVSGIKRKGVALTLASSSSVSSGEYYWDYSAKRLYINTTISSSIYIIVFFEMYFATKSYNGYRNPMSTSSQEMYYSPRIIPRGVSIPEMNREDLQLFGTSSGSISLNNADGSFYIYSGFHNKNIKLYHVINDDYIKYIYKGKIESFSIDDSSLKLQFRSFDHVFNNTIRTSLLHDIEINTDPAFVGYTRRIVYGVIDDSVPINIDYDEEATTTNNRRWFCKDEYNTQHQLSLTTQTGSTTSNLVVGANHYLKVGDSVYNSTITESSFVTAVNSDNVDISPAFTTIAVGQTIERSTIGYVKILDGNGVFYNLDYGIDYTEIAPMAGFGLLDFVGFELADDFESNHAGLTTFNPATMQIFCRIYGKKHATTNDSEIGNLTDSSLILIDLMSTYAGLTTDDYDESTITALSDSRPLGFAIPEDLSTEYPTYRDIIKKINQSTLGQLYIDDNNKISYRYLSPLSASSYTLNSTKILKDSLSFDYNNDEIYSAYKICFYRKENSNGSGRSSQSYSGENSNKALYLHEIKRTLEVPTYLIYRADASVMADRYKILYEDWQINVNLDVKSQLMENSIGDTITIEREKLIGYNYVKRTLRSITCAITSMKKALGGVSITANTQKNIEDNSGDW
jgi:hypothetical protein